jgi:hypothetical protein
MVDETARYSPLEVLCEICKLPGKERKKERKKGK